MKILLRFEKELIAVEAHKVAWKDEKLFIWTRDFSYCVEGIDSGDGEALVRKVFSGGTLDLSGYKALTLK